ncbi:16S rRNA (uracil(1498)-N(3))-methyltransferase [Moraxella pluranimalium]|uniref:Ribosomal RNA small subunit methyltransferase E n=1 Tax=Moraxella pluranimalium TaxID=470453 RepID=A0A1T0CG43_9GAMM|nr:16S rRNA (uracil(1498)-N(3))-methyltransferase [Moraxella pluranimalium]OOS21306.1 16S rRNA (uracil(1498)-N(3))-methyltransferase [Moraxella pluranimalium]
MNIILLNPSDITGETARIDDKATITHIRTVLGAGVGDTLKVGCRHGLIGTAIITQMGDDGIRLGMLSLDKSPPPKLNLTVILALPRPKVLRRLVMDMTAMGVNRIVLINSYRTDKSYWGSPLLNKIDEYITEGLQQGIDTVPPQIVMAKRFKPFVQDELPAIIGDGKALVAHPYADISFGRAVQDGLPSVLIVGAEGGFIPYEIELLGSVGVQAVSLGSRILRTESAVNALLGRWLN